MSVFLQQFPIQASLFTPFPDLAEFLSHEQEFFTRVRYLISICQTQIGKFLRVVARHLGIERSFHVNDLVVRNTEQEFLTVGIDHREGKLIMMSAAEHRIVFHILDEVIHPSHIPFIVKAKTVVLQIPGDLRPCGGFLGNQHRVRNLFFEDTVQVFQEIDRFQVFIAAVNVCNPLAVLFSIVQIKHGGNRIHPDAVCVVFFRPEQRVCDQEIGHLWSSVIIDQRSPVRMGTLSRIKMLIQAGSVKG